MAFVYDTFVTGKNFIGRKAESNAVRNLLGHGTSVCIYEPPKAGKMSVIQQALFNMRLSGVPFTAPQTDLFNCRDTRSLALKLASSIIRSAASTPAEYAGIIETMLKDTRFHFDQTAFSENDEVVCLDGNPDRNDLDRLFRLPGEIAARTQSPVFVIIKEFQSILDLGEDASEEIFGIMEGALAGRPDGEKGYSVWILTGSRVNAMKYIFEEKKYFHRLIEHIPLQQVDSREIEDHMIRGFLTGGKVMEQDLAASVVRLFKGNLRYINHFSAICDSLSKGYMNEGIMMDALNIILSVNEDRFKNTICSLTSHQLNFLKAILDGEKKFSSVEVIGKYGLHSSANVRRVKDALRKKETITFDDKDEPVILDPLFEYWLSRFYFGKQ